MTTVRTIIKDAYRESNLIPEEQELTAAQFTEGLRILNRLVQSVTYNELGDPLTTVNMGDNNVQVDQYMTTEVHEQFVEDYYVPANSRLVLNLENPLTVNLHPRPNDGTFFEVIDASNNLSTNNLTIVGNGRRIEDAASITLNVDGTADTWFYRNDTSNWHKITSLASGDDFPFPEAFDDMFIIALAMRLAPRNGAALTGETIEAFRRSRSQFRARYKQKTEMPVEEALLRFMSQGGNYIYSDDNQSFDRGSII
jgi:hypothetical protein